MKRSCTPFWKDETAATLVEYAVAVSLISIICIAAVTLFGSKISAFFITTAGTL